MYFWDLIDLVSTNLKLRKNRTILTILGIVVASTCIFTLMSLGNGFKESSIKSFEDLGDIKAVTVYPMPKNYSNIKSKSSYKTKDAINDDSIKEISSIKGVQDIIIRLPVPIDKVHFKQKSIEASVIGTNLNQSLSSYELLYGRYPNINERKAVLGYNIACSLLKIDPIDPHSYKKLKNILNKTMIFEYSIIQSEDDVKVINNETYDVDNTNDDYEKTFDKENALIGICGITTNNSQFSWDISIPLKIARNIYKSVHNNENKVQYSSISVICNKLNDVSKVENNILKLGYTAYSLISAKESIDKVMTLITIFIGFLGSISILISSFGIINTMNMSIIERKKEIGIIKVLGASINDIKRIFILEAGLMGFIGGIIGILIGFIINFVGNHIVRIYQASQNDTLVKDMFIITPFLVIFTMIFSTSIGILAGLYPASKASKLDIISTLRDE